MHLRAWYGKYRGTAFLIYYDQADFSFKSKINHSYEDTSKKFVAYYRSLNFSVLCNQICLLK